MKETSDVLIALVTAPDLDIARMLARVALETRLAACANLVPGVESHYWWQGKIESSAEVLVIFKTVKSKAAALEALILARHPYDTAEFVVLPLSAGSEKYLAWVGDSTR